MLNDKNREPFSSIDYLRFEKVLKLAEQLKHWNVSMNTYSSRVMRFLSDTSNALNVTSTGLVSLIKQILDHGFSYVFPGNFQSD